jgi:hypothetical protein
MKPNGDIYKMKLHEQIFLTNTSGVLGTEVTRVAGGWIYTTFNFNHNISSSVFVPFDNEFQQKYDDDSAAEANTKLS